MTPPFKIFFDFHLRASIAIIWSPFIIFPFSSHIIILSASPSNEMPTCALFFLTADWIFSGKVDPHFSLILNPFGLIPIDITFAPRFLSNLGAAIYPAPFPQSKTILVPLKWKLLGKFFFNILIYLSFPSSSLLTLPSKLGFVSCFVLALPFFLNSLAGDLFYTSVLEFSFNKINKTLYKS